LHTTNKDQLNKNYAAHPRCHEKPVQAIWNDALAGVLKAVPVYDYKMDRETGTRQLPVIANKVEGFQKDKVLYDRLQNSKRRPCIGAESAGN